jgi:hypothetical protein
MPVPTGRPKHLSAICGRRGWSQSPEGASARLPARPNLPMSQKTGSSTGEQTQRPTSHQSMGSHVYQERRTIPVTLCNAPLSLFVVPGGLAEGARHPITGQKPAAETDRNPASYPIPVGLHAGRESPNTASREQRNARAPLNGHRPRQPSQARRRRPLAFRASSARRAALRASVAILAACSASTSCISLVRPSVSSSARNASAA